MVVARFLTCYRATEPHPFGLSLLKPVRQFNPFGLSLSKPGRHPQPVRAEPVEGCALVVLRAFVKGGGRESPGVRVTFFRVAERKSPKKGRPPVCDPCASLRGHLRRGGCGVRRRTHCAAVQLRSDNCGELDHEACALRRACSPRNRPAAGAASRGWTAEHPDSRTATRAFASLGRAVAARSACALGAERSAAKQWPEWMLAPQSPLYAPRSAAGGVACVPQDTHASWPSSPQLFERSAPARSEFCGAPRPRAPQVAPARSAGDADSGVAFSLVTFFWRSKRKPLRRRAHTPASAFNPNTLLKPARDPKLQQAQPERRLQTIKIIAISA